MRPRVLEQFGKLPSGTYSRRIAPRQITPCGRTFRLQACRATNLPELCLTGTFRLQASSGSSSDARAGRMMTYRSRSDC